MEETSESGAPTQDNSLCVACNTNKFEPGYPMNLCISCRENYIKYPIPNWLKFFAIGLLAVIIVSLLRTQKYISAAVHLGRGEKAIETKHFFTAERELKAVLEQFPDDITTNGNMIIASAYNLDFQSGSAAYSKIATKEFEDKEFLSEVNAAMDYIGQNYVQDTIMERKITESAKERTLLLKYYEELDTTNEVALKTFIADKLYDLKDYSTVEQILNKILNGNPNFYYAISLMSSAKRQLGKYDEALKYCDQLLDLNKEDINAFAQKARIELKRKRDKQAEVYARAAMQIDPANNSALESMSMVKYFLGYKKESFDLYSKIKAQEVLNGDSTISSRLMPILNGSIAYR